MKGATAATAASTQLLFPRLCSTSLRKKEYLTSKWNLLFVFCLLVASISPGYGLVLSRPAALQAATATEHASKPHTPQQGPQHTPQPLPEVDEHQTEVGSKTEASASSSRPTTSTETHEGAAQEQQLQQQKPESAAEAAPPAATAAPSAAEEAAPSTAAAEPAPRPATTASSGAAAAPLAAVAAPSAAAEGGERSPSSVLREILRAPYEEGVGRLYTEGKNLVDMLQQSLKASRGLTAAANISSKLRGDIVKDVEALRDTLQKEHDNLLLLQQYERQQEALLKSQLGYLAPLIAKGKAGDEKEKEGEKKEKQDQKLKQIYPNPLQSTYTSRAAPTSGVSAAAFVSFLLFVLII